jgi:hypothetical protein
LLRKFLKKNDQRRLLMNDERSVGHKLEYKKCTAKRGSTLTEAPSRFKTVLDQTQISYWGGRPTFRNTSRCAL